MTDAADAHGSDEQAETLPLLAEEAWQPLPARLTAPAADFLLPEELTRNWSLTLTARQIPCRAEMQENGWHLLVPVAVYDQALDEVRRFEAANHNWPPPLPPASPPADNLLITLSVLFLLAIFHNLTRLEPGLLGLSTADWIDRGDADAGALLSGDWWRAITALTLHADGLHLLGNLTIGGLFILLVCRTLGSGLGWFLLLASGGLGNLLNAWFQSSLHRSVGASTTVFGAVGLLASLNLIHDRQRLRRRWYLPLAAALALLALLGSEGENTDLGAHLFGFASGGILGLGSAYLQKAYGRPGARLNALLALCSLALVGAAWWTALHAS